MPNRIWLPAMVTWRGTEDGFVTRDVHDIYLRYALGGPGMIVLEATGIRDVASGPLLRLSDDRFVPGLRALVGEMRAAGDALVMPQIIDFLKIATRKPTRAFLEGLVARGALPASVLGLSDAEFEKDHAQHLTPRQQRDFFYGYRQTIEDLSLDEIRRIPGWFAAAARRARAAGFDGVELHFAHAYTMASFLSVTNRRRDDYGGSFENRMRLPLEVVRDVRAEVGRDFLVAGRHVRQDRRFRSGGGDPAGRPGRSHRHGARIARRSRPAPQVVRRSRRRPAGLRFLPILRRGRSAASRGDVHAVAQGSGGPPLAAHPGGLAARRAVELPAGLQLRRCDAP